MKILSVLIASLLTVSFTATLSEAQSRKSKSQKSDRSSQSKRDDYSSSRNRYRSQRSRRKLQNREGTPYIYDNYPDWAARAFAAPDER